MVDKNDPDNTYMTEEEKQEYYEEVVPDSCTSITPHKIESPQVDYILNSELFDS